MTKMNYCLGTVQFGLDYGIQDNGKPDEDKVFEMINYAADNGVGILDTASAYGKAEIVLGNYFKTYPQMKNKLKVVSKLRPDAFNCETEKWSDIAVREADNSLSLIGVDKLIAFLLHNSNSVFDDSAVNAISTVKSVGLADKVGVSVYSPEEALKALEYDAIEAIQVPYNVFDRRLDKCGFFKLAKEKNVMVFARSSLLQGLVMMDPYNLPEKVRFARDYLISYRNICSKYGFDLLDAAVGYVGCKSGIDYVVFGVDNLSQLKEYISMNEINLPSKMITEFDKVFDSIEERLVNPVLWK